MFDRNLLLYGDNLDLLRDQTQFPTASVDLIYLDPPFNSNAGYNILFKEAGGEASAAQIETRSGRLAALRSIVAPNGP